MRFGPTSGALSQSPDSYWAVANTNSRVMSPAAPATVATDDRLARELGSRRPQRWRGVASGAQVVDGALQRDGEMRLLGERVHPEQQETIDRRGWLGVQQRERSAETRLTL